MKTFPTEKIRNVLLFGHQGTGKTSLAEALLFNTGATTRVGRIEDGNTVCDFEPEEVKRSISVSMSMVPLEYSDHKINLLDSPGYADFLADVQAGMRVADLAVLVVSAVEGVEVQHQILWELAGEASLPRIVFINKCERERASFSRTLDNLSERLGGGFAPIHVPIGKEHDFVGVADVLTERSFTYDDSGKGTEVDIPEELAGQAGDLHKKVVESVAESDDSLLERYLDGESLEAKEIITGLSKGLAAGAVFPVLAGSATKLVGIDRLANFIVEAGPSPADRGPASGTTPGSEEEIKRNVDPGEPTSAFVFKTLSDPYVGRVSMFRVMSGKITPDSSVYNINQKSNERLAHIFTMRGKDHENISEAVAGDLVAVAKLAHTASGDTLADKSSPIQFAPLAPPEHSLAKAIAPKTKGDEDKLMTGLSKLLEEDSSLQLERNRETKQTVLWGTGETHLDVALERLSRKFGIEVRDVPLRIAYRETVAKPAQGVGKHVKQSGGHGQYGVAHLEIRPLDRGAGFQFVNKIVGGAIPHQFIPSVEKGVVAAMSDGILAGYPVVDLEAKLYDGKFHPVDSSDIAFQMAGRQAFKEACQAAGVVLLEPIHDLEVTVPDAFLGDVLGDLNGKRGKIQGTESAGRGRQVVNAKVPLAEVTRYAIDLRSMTGGQGVFRMDFSHYEPLPSHLKDSVVADAKKAAEETK